MSSRAVTFAGWAVLGAALVLVQVLAVRGARIASLRELLRTVTRARAGQVLALVGWLWVGWHVFVRSSR
jgi:hypothetical protein